MNFFKKLVIASLALITFYTNAISDNHDIVKNNTNADKVILCLKNFYKKSNFVKIEKKGSLLSTNSVINTNNCKISVINSKEKNRIIILSAIDNLIKGGAGQAVQNLNMIYN